MQRPVHQRPSHDAAALAVDHDEVEHEILDEKLSSDAQGLPIECVEQSMPRAVRRCASARDRVLAEVAHMSAERPLIDFSVFGAGEGHPRMLKLDHRGSGLPAHVFDSVLVAEPVGPLDRVVHMPLPAILAEVAETGGNAPLGRDSVAARRKYLRDAGSRQARLYGPLGGTQPRAAGTDDHYIKRVVDEFVSGP